MPSDDSDCLTGGPSGADIRTTVKNFTTLEKKNTSDIVENNALSAKKERREGHTVNLGIVLTILAKISIDWKDYKFLSCAKGPRGGIFSLSLRSFNSFGPLIFFAPPGPVEERE